MRMNRGGKESKRETRKMEEREKHLNLSVLLTS